MDKLVKSLIIESLSKSIISNGVKIKRPEGVYYIDGAVLDKDNIDYIKVYNTNPAFSSGVHSLLRMDLSNIFTDSDMYEDTSNQSSKLADKKFLDSSKIDTSAAVIYDKESDSIIYDIKTKTSI